MDLIVIPYSSDLPSSYQLLLNQLLDSLKNANGETQFELLMDFSNKYTMLPEFWNVLIQLDLPSSMKIQFATQSLAHFSTTEAFSLLSEYPPCFKLKNLENLDQKLCPQMILIFEQLKVKEELILKHLSFPHKHLDRILSYYEEFVGPISPQLADKVVHFQKLYVNLENDFENVSLTFFDVNDQIEDKEVQINNIELLLARKPYSKEIWLKYFYFLRDANDGEAFDKVYRRYRGIFLDDGDSELIMKIKNDVKVGKAETLATIHQQSNIIKVVKNFTFANAIFQIPPFPKPMNHYLYSNVTPNLLMKLQISDKHFLQCLTKRVFHCLEITGEAMNFNKSSLSIPYEHPVFSQLNNLWLTSSLTIFSEDATPEVIQKTAECDLKYLRIRYQNLSWDSYVFFVKAGNIKLLELYGVLDKKNNGQHALLEDILAKTPKVFSIQLISGFRITPQTFENLLKQNFEKKLSYFGLDGIREPIHAETCVEFLKKTLAPNAKICMDFDENYPGDNFDALSAALDDMRENWEVPDEKPELVMFLIP